MSKNKKAIAVIGQGFVGGSLSLGMQHVFDVFAYDKAKVYKQNVKNGAYNRVGKDSLESLIANMENMNEYAFEPTVSKRFVGIYFVCLPTPMYEDGEADLRIVENTLDIMATCPGDKKRIAVVKSTIPPGTTERWNNKYKNTNLTVVFNPEFLTEANAVNDFKNQTRIILGGPRPQINKVKQIYQAAFPKVKIIKTSSTTAEMVKYTTNCFLATKVSFANEMAQICEKLNENDLNIDYDKVVEYATHDRRLGLSHWAVPGPVPTADGRYVRGFGGHCVTENTDVLMLDSVCKIQDIKPGDIVGSSDHLISKFEIKKVKQVSGRMYEGDVLTFKTKTTSVTVTPEHILPVLRNNTLILLQAKDIKCSDELFIIGE